MLAGSKTAAVLRPSRWIWAGPTLCGLAPLDAAQISFFLKSV
jgi:hypothetical protein